MSFETGWAGGVILDRGHIAKLSIVITAKVIFISIIKFCIDYMQNTDLLYEKTLS